MAQTITLNKEGVRYFSEQFNQLKINFIPSATNFITTVWESDSEAQRISSALFKCGVIVRELSSFGGQIIYGYLSELKMKIELS